MAAAKGIMTALCVVLGFASVVSDDTMAVEMDAQGSVTASGQRLIRRVQKGTQRSGAREASVSGNAEQEIISLVEELSHEREELQEAKAKIEELTSQNANADVEESTAEGDEDAEFSAAEVDAGQSSAGHRFAVCKQGEKLKRSCLCEGPPNRHLINGKYRFCYVGRYCWKGTCRTMAGIWYGSNRIRPTSSPTSSPSSWQGFGTVSTPSPTSWHDIAGIKMINRMIKNKHCAYGKLTAKKYTDLNKAKAECSKRQDCMGIYDNGCNSPKSGHLSASGFWLCRKGKYLPWSRFSCVIAKQSRFGHLLEDGVSEAAALMDEMPKSEMDQQEFPSLTFVEGSTEEGDGDEEFSAP